MGKSQRNTNQFKLVIMAALTSIMSIYMAQNYFLSSWTLSSTSEEVTEMKKENQASILSYRKIEIKDDGVDPFMPSKDIINRLARPFLPVNSSIWYVPEPENFTSSDEQGDEPAQGLLFVKVPKTASSTISGVAERISRHFSKKGLLQNWHNDRFNFIGRSERSFLCGSIRSPTSRAMSRVFFDVVSRKSKEPTDKRVKKKLKSYHKQFGCSSKGRGGFQLTYMSLKDIKKGAVFKSDFSLNYVKIYKFVRKIMEKYDFIILSERIDESLVLMKLLLGLSFGDILYLPSKVSGTDSYFKEGSRCIKLYKSYISPGVAEFLASDFWRREIFGDVLLHSVVNKSLDLTIDSIGRDLFQKELKLYKLYKDKASKRCASQTFLPCSNKGIVQRNKSNCYEMDWGCGYPCLDEFVRNNTILTKISNIF